MDKKHDLVFNIEFKSKFIIDYEEVLGHCSFV